MQPEATQTSINRAEFLRSLGLSTGALMALYCMGTLTACSGGSDDPTPGTGTGTTTGNGLTGNAKASSGAINFTLDLSHANYSKLKTVGEFVQVNDVIVANAKGTMVALSNICTHQGGQLQYNATNNNFPCNLHSGIYTTTGTVISGEPTKAVAAYKTSLSGNTLSVTV